MQEQFCRTWNARGSMEFLEIEGGVGGAQKGRAPGLSNETRGSSGKRDRQNES